MNIKKGDQVKVLSGKDRARSGKVLEVFPENNRVVVEGLNIHVRFSRPKRKGEKGQRLELPSPLSVSKVMLVCPHCNRTTRVGHSQTDDGRFRKCKKCGKLIL